MDFREVTNLQTPMGTEHFQNKKKEEKPHPTLLKLKD